MIDKRISSSGRGKGKGHRRIDISGQRFGRLVALQPTARRECGYGAIIWEFICDCGKLTYASTTSVKSGHKRSCGCIRLRYRTNNSHDLTGKKVGYLTVVKEVQRLNDETDKHLPIGTVWLCRCDCGNYVKEISGALVQANRTSCGCMYRSPELMAHAAAASGRVNGTLISQIASKKIWTTNRSGVRGVCIDKHGVRWRAYIVFQRKQYYLGVYDTIEEAAEARKRAEEQYFAEAIEKYQSSL